MSAFEISPSFIDSPQGRIFTVHRYPKEGEARHGVILVPPFAEEMNRARRMMTLLAEALAERGCHTMILDLYGTGDSEGEFSEASWDGWISQLGNCIDYLQSEYLIKDYSLVALRAGALLAADYLKQSDNKPVRQVLWQPTIDGTSFLTQFLRLRLAADMISGGEGRDTVASLKQALESGQNVEIAGYALNFNVSQGLENASLKQLPPDKFPPTLWMECVSSKEKEAPLAAREFIKKLASQDVSIRQLTCVSSPFWNSVEIVENHAVVAKTVGYICKGLQ